MGKLLTRALFLIFIAAVGAQAGSYYVTYREIVPGGDNIVHLDPLLNGYGEFGGYSACNAGDRLFEVRDELGTVTHSFSLPGAPVSSTHWRDPQDDILHFWVLCDMSSAARDQGRHMVLHLTVPEQGDTDSAVFNISPTYEGYVKEWTRRYVNLAVETDGVREPRVRVEVSVGFLYDFVYFDYCDGDIQSVSRLYSADLGTVLASHEAAPVRQGHLVSDSSVEMYSFHETADQLRDHDCTTGAIWQQSTVKISVSDQYGTMREQVTNRGQVTGCFIDNFIPWEPRDEVLIAGYLNDHANGRLGPTHHVACYTFSEEFPRELWYREVPGWQFSHVYKPEHQLAGLTDDNRQVVLLDYWSGEPTDSIALDRTIKYPAFFDTRSVAALNLIGRSSDTIFVYRFDAPSAGADLQGPSEQELPSTLTLHPNYPNPFNGSTQISFTTSVGQHVTLSVFNVLGQEISVLFDGYASAGDYEATWDGKDMTGHEQASGIYFAQLRAGADSKMIKLIFLK